MYKYTIFLLLFYIKKTFESLQKIVRGYFNNKKNIRFTL